MKKRIVHSGAAEAQAALHPIGTQSNVTAHAKTLLEDFRLAACLFGNAQEQRPIIERWEAMQMRYSELAEYVSRLEASGPYRRSEVMKF